MLQPLGRGRSGLETTCKFLTSFIFLCDCNLVFHRAERKTKVEIKR